MWHRLVMISLLRLEMLSGADHGTSPRYTPRYTPMNGNSSKNNWFIGGGGWGAAFLLFIYYTGYDWSNGYLSPVVFKDACLNIIFAEFFPFLTKQKSNDVKLQTRQLSDWGLSELGRYHAWKHWEFLPRARGGHHHHLCGIVFSRELC